MPRRIPDARQLALSHAPIYDGTGLHARDCPCPRCEQGYRPTTAQRNDAEQAQRRVRYLAQKAAEEGEHGTRRELAAAQAAFRAQSREEETRLRVEADEKFAARRHVPSSDEFARLRAECGLPPRRGRRP